MKVNENSEQHRERIADFLKPHFAAIFRQLDSEGREIRQLSKLLRNQSPSDYMIEGSELFFGDSVTRERRKAALTLSIYEGIISSMNETEEKLWGRI